MPSLSARRGRASTCVLLFCILCAPSLARTGAAQVTARVSGWPVLVETPGAEISESPDGVRIEIEASDPTTGLSVDVRTVDPSRIGNGSTAGTRNSVGPVRWMAPESIRDRRHSGLSIAGVGTSSGSGNPWAMQIDFDGTGLAGDGGPSSYVASAQFDGTPIAGDAVSLRLTNGNGDPLHEGTGQQGTNVLYQGSAPPTSSTWTLVPAASTSLLARAAEDAPFALLRTLRTTVRFEVGTRLSFFDPLDPDTPIVVLIEDADAALEMDQELDPIIGGSLRSQVITVFDDDGGPLGLTLRSAAHTATGQQIRPLEGTLADLWIDPDGASVLELTPPPGEAVAMQTTLEECTFGVAIRPTAPSDAGPRIPLRTDGAISRVQLTEMDDAAHAIRATSAFIAYAVATESIQLGLESTDPGASGHIELLDANGSVLAAHAIELGVFAASIAAGAPPEGSELPALGVNGPDETGRIAFHFHLVEPTTVSTESGDAAGVAEIVLRSSALALVETRSRIVDVVLELEPGIPATLVAAKEWVRPCPAHVMCSARGLGRADVSTIGEQGVVIGNIGRGALTGGAGASYPGGVRLDCIDGRHALLELAIPPDPVLPAPTAWQMDVRLQEDPESFARAFTLPVAGGLGLGFDLSSLTGAPTVHVQHFDAQGNLLAAVDAMHGEIALEVQDAILSFHVDMPGHADYFSLSWGLGAFGADAMSSDALGRTSGTSTGRVVATIDYSGPGGLRSIDVRADGPAMAVLLVGDESIGVAVPPTPSRGRRDPLGTSGSQSLQPTHGDPTRARSRYRSRRTRLRCARTRRAKTLRRDDAGGSVIVDLGRDRRTGRYGRLRDLLHPRRERHRTSGPAEGRAASLNRGERPRGDRTPRPSSFEIFASPPQNLWNGWTPRGHRGLGRVKLHPEPHATAVSHFPAEVQPCSSLPSGSVSMCTRNP
jgi:hypothetical protein